MAPQPFAPLWLSEVQPFGTNFVDNAGEPESWIEIYNSSTNIVSLGGLFLGDNFTNLTRWPFPTNSAIRPGEFKVIWMDGEVNETSGTNLHAGFRLQPQTGTIALVQVLGDGPHILDYINYNNLKVGWSYGSYPNGQLLDRFNFTSPTPGRANQPLDVHVYINEWMASNSRTRLDPADGQPDDWFELYNPSHNPVDLTGYWLSDIYYEDRKPKFQIPFGTVIPARGFLVVWADSESEQNGPGRDLHVNFGLNKGGESIYLVAPDGVAILDSVTFGQQTTDISQGRWPDSGRNIIFMPTPTPGASNVGGTNSAPQVTVRDIVLPPGSVLDGYKPLVSDNESPPQVLGFSLLSGPAGASVDPIGGALFWFPRVGPARTNLFTIRVADDGSPPLETIASFTVVVLGPPRAAITRRLLDGTLELKWDAILGKTYRVQTKSSLRDAQWLDLSPALLSQGEELTFRVPLTEPQRFYRIVLMN